MTAKEIKQAIKSTKAEMRRLGVQRKSVFNGGLTSDERYYNGELFRLETLLTKVGTQQ